MYQRHLIAGVDGNVSARLGMDRVLTTPAGCNKGYLAPEDLVVTTLSGKCLRPGGKRRDRMPSSELAMHLEVYRCRPEVQAVVHAHPPVAVARTVAGRPVTVPAIPEAVAYLGPVPTASYAKPGTAEVPASIRDILQDRTVRALMLDRHGSLTFGCDIFEAFDRLDALEHTANTMCVAEALGPVTPLPGDEIRRLSAQHRASVNPTDAERTKTTPSYRR